MTTLIKWAPGHGGGYTAQTQRGGTYYVRDTKDLGRDGFGAFYRPPQGRAKLPKGPVALGNVKDFEAARELCERHHHATVKRWAASQRKKRPAGTPGGTVYKWKGWQTRTMCRPVEPIIGRVGNWRGGH